MKNVDQSKFEKRIDILLEAYKMINDEAKIYLNEIFKCFIYAAIIIGVFLGGEIGLFGEENPKFREYIPFALVILIIYFLSLAYNYISILRYRGILERKINFIFDERVLDYDSFYKRKILSSGFIGMKSKWYAKLPSPNFLLGILISVTLFVLISSSELLTNTRLSLLLLIICGVIAVYVYLIYPSIIKKKIKNEYHDE